MRGRRVSANPQSNKKCVTVWFQMTGPENVGFEANLDGPPARLLRLRHQPKAVCEETRRDDNRSHGARLS